MASCCDHRSLLLYKCCGGSSQGFDDDPAYIGMLVVVITQIRCCTSAAGKVLMILHMLVVVITDLLLLYKCSGSHQGLTESVCLHVSLCVCIFVLCQQLNLLSCYFNQGEHKLVLLMKAAVDYILPLARTHEMTLKKTKSAATE